MPYRLAEETRMNATEILTKFDKESFSRADLYEQIRSNYPSFKESQLRYFLGKFLNEGQIIRVGRNTYELNHHNLKDSFTNAYSDKALQIVTEIEQRYPLLDFRVWELRWLNEFLNHQIGQNKIFVEVDNDACDYIFSTIAELSDFMVLVKPRVEDIFRYGKSDTVIINRLIKESPVGKPYKYNLRLEKLIVDLFADKYLCAMLSPADYPEAITSMFNMYCIDTSTLRRYARRRNKESFIEQYLSENAGIILNKTKP